MGNLTLATSVAIILATAFLGGILARRFRQPAILGYILAGVTIGGWAIGFTQGREALASLAEIGIVFLMFALGLELSFARLRRVWEVAFWGGIIQILVTIILGILIFQTLGFDFYSSLFLGCTFSLSSTAVVVKILSERGELDSLPADITLGWLLIQDLAVLPMMVILPSIGRIEVGGWMGVLGAIAKATILLILVIFLGKKVVPILISKIADLGSRELLLIAVVAICLLFAVLTANIGLSTALGAFLAGLIIAETSEHHAVFAEIRPLRDFFAIIFFVSLGMFLRPDFLLSHFGQILGFSLIVIVIKLLLVTALVLYLGYHTKTAFLVGMGLVQVGEFAFILAQVGLKDQLINPEVYSLILSVALLTILVTPWFINYAPRVYLFLRKKTKEREPILFKALFTRFDHQKVHEEGLELSGHVVVCGHGRVGSWLGRALELTGIPYIVIDYNHQIIAELRQRGIKALYGDPADSDVLDYAQVEKARAVVIAIPDRATQELVIQHCQTLNPAATIICRTHRREDQARLKALGVETVIQPEFEAALSMIHRVLQKMGVSREEVAGKIKRIKIEHGMG